ncbi:MAG TPA: lipoyl(octanoyl) transferase LipB [Tepidisphaeraceae bacterium]|nr:lipoyl(octanoyl) transferase LipB [Tepidisphaeraceae bacterium]
MQTIDLQTMAYREAWAVQERVWEEVAGGAGERLLLVEHPPVITLGRRGGCDRHLLAEPEELERRGVEVVPSDRGGDITFHGPGQLVAYPIIRLIDHRLSIGGYVKALQTAAIATLGRFGVAGQLDPSAVGVWARLVGGELAKICAIGVRVKRGITLHGLALNVETDLDYFRLIVPCGLAGRGVTSMREILGDRAPSMRRVKDALREELGKLLGA